MPLDGTNYEQQQQDADLDLLRRGLDRVAKGWCQHVLWRPNRRPFGFDMCARGAILSDSRGCALEEAAMSDLFDALPPEWQTIPYSPTMCVVLYNNAPGRTQEDIVTLFEHAIARREEILKGVVYA